MKVELQLTKNSCLRNVVTLFSFIEKEKAWRREHGRPEGFEALNRTKPIGMWLFESLGMGRLLTEDAVAVGAEEPLAEHMMAADYFRKLSVF